MAVTLARVFRSCVEPAPICALALGFGLGALAMMPFGLRVDPAVAGVMATLVGSLFAIGGALAVLHYGVYRQGRNVAQYILDAMEPIVHCSANIAMVMGELEAGNINKLQTARECIPNADVLARSLEKMPGRLQRIEPSTPTMHANALEAYALMEAALDQIGTQSDELLAHMQRHVAGGSSGGMVEAGEGLNKLAIQFALNFRDLANHYGLPLLTGTKRALRTLIGNFVGLE